VERHATGQVYQPPVSGIARLYEYLAHVRTFPTPVRVAALVSGIPDKDVKRVLEGSPYFTILDDDSITLGDIAQSIS